MNELDLIWGELCFFENMEAALPSDSIEDAFMEGVYDVVNTIERIFQSIIEYMNSFISSLSRDIALITEKRNTKRKLKDLKEQIKNDPDSVPKVILFPDMPKINKTYANAIEQFTKRSRKLINMKIDKEGKLNKFEEEADNLDLAIKDFEEQITELLGAKKEVPREEAIRYIENVLSGRNNCYDRYYELIKQMEHLHGDINASISEKSLKVAQLDTNVAHPNRIKTLMNKISRTFSKMLRKIIVTVAFWL